MPARLPLRVQVPFRSSFSALGSLDSRSLVIHLVGGKSVTSFKQVDWFPWNELLIQICWGISTPRRFLGKDPIRSAGLNSNLPGCITEYLFKLAVVHLGHLTKGELIQNTSILRSKKGLGLGVDTYPTRCIIFHCNMMRRVRVLPTVYEFGVRSTSLRPEIGIPLFKHFPMKGYGLLLSILKPHRTFITKTPGVPDT